MAFIVDTCIFLDQLNTADNILTAAKCSHKVEKVMGLTDIVFSEIKYPISIRNTIENGIRTKVIKLFEVKTNNKYKSNFNEIRRRYYEHLSPSVLQKKIQSGEYTKEQAKELRFKDYGECSCIAVAIENPDRVVIISDDQGHIHLKPDINLFVKYQDDYGIKVWYFHEWDRHTKYSQQVS